MSGPARASRLDAAASAVLRPFRARMDWILFAAFVCIALPFVTVGVLGATVALSRVAVVAVFAVASLPAIVMLVALQRARSLSARHQEALDRGDLDAVVAIRRVMEGPPERQNRFQRANSALGHAELLLRMERWPEARDAFAQLDTIALPETARPIVVSERAVAMAHAGEAEAALALVQQAIADADRLAEYPREKLWHLRARLGIVRSLAGRHDDAVETLGPLLEESPGNDPVAWTEAMFFLAQSLRGSGNTDDAMAVLEQALEGEGPFVARVRATLDLAKGAPLRVGAMPTMPVTEPDEEVASNGEARRARRRPRP
ncbi:MAG: tetratricopeptide repeat protein [Deltaproteobacteria bacterium]|nr:tetratricopeptide repeat protein [Deltaproteobacteria bacterium]